MLHPPTPRPVEGEGEGSVGATVLGVRCIMEPYTRKAGAECYCSSHS